MSRLSGVGLVIDASRVPALDGAMAAIAAGVRTGGSNRNEEFVAARVRIHPDVASANYNVALALKQQGKTNEAQIYFDKAERLKRGETPRNP